VIAERAGWRNEIMSIRISIAIVIFLSCLPWGQAVPSQEAEIRRVMTYNVFLGFNKKQSLEIGAEWLKAQNCDVLALQELKGFNQERLETAAQTWGHDYAVIFDRKGGFPQGLTSKFPIEKVAQIQPENNPKLRGTLHCNVGDIHFFVVHFDPRNYLNRQKEANAVAEVVAPLIRSGEQVVVLGDFNAHSPADKEVMSSRAELLAKWREREDGRHRSFDANGELDYSVLQTLLDAGLQDPSSRFVATFPSRLNFPEVSSVELDRMSQRIDYILVSRPLEHGRLLYPRDKILDQISDHYPVVLSFEE